MEEQEFMDYLLSLESPFSWNIPKIENMTHDNFIDTKIEKFENSQDENDFQWPRFILGLLLSYEISKRQQNTNKTETTNTRVDSLKGDCNRGQETNQTSNTRGPLYYTTWCKNHLLSLDTKGCQEQLFTSLFPTLLAVNCITEAIILLQSGKVDNAHEVIEELPFTPSICSSSDYQAGLLGTQAALYLQYGTFGHRLALKAAEQARELDQHQAEWWFLIGNSLGRIRRVENTPISEEEIKAIEKAFALENNATYIVHLAQLYSEYSSYWYFNQNPKQAKTYAEAAVTRYRDAIKLRPNCVILKARVAHGMLRIRDKQAADICFAKKLLDEIVDSTISNSMVYHDLGYYYEKFEKNTEEALFYLNRANYMGNIKALIYMVSVKWKLGRRDEAIGDLQEALTRYKSVENRAQLLAYLGACHALVKDDWDSAVEFIKESLLIDPSAKYLEKFYGFDNRTINLLELVVNHLKYKVIPRMTDSLETYRSFLKSVQVIKPNIVHSSGARDKFTKWNIKQLRILDQ